MTRAQGFARGDLDTSFPIDDKFLALRAITDPATYYAATGVYWHIAAAAWREAERKPASRITPEAPELIALLVRVGLLDGDECVQRRAYAHSVGRALRTRRTSTDRKSRNRAGMSRVTARDGRGRHGVSTDIQSSTEQSSTEQSSADRPPALEGGNDPYDAPELPALSWLTEQGCYIAPVSGYYRQLVLVVENYGVEAVIAKFDTLKKAGVKRGDVRNFLFGAIDALNGKVDIKGLETEERAEADRDRRTRAADAARKAAEDEDARRARLLAEKPRPLRELMPDVKIGRASS